jgi:hypothetical protein
MGRCLNFHWNKPSDASELNVCSQYQKGDSAVSNYKAVVEVTGTFNDWTLKIQEHIVPLLLTPEGGYHAEATIDIGSDKKIAIFWFAKGHSGVDWTFEITVSPILSGGSIGSPKTWSDKGTLPAASQVGINGVLLLDNMKDGGAAGDPTKHAPKKGAPKKGAAPKVAS